MTFHLFSKIKKSVIFENKYVLLISIVGIFSIWVVLFFIDQPLLEVHGFRQTQTALTAYYYLHEGWQLDYQTPVAGYPWSIPFEFPIYQSIVALISKITLINLNVVGRFISYCFLLAILWPVKKIIKNLQLNENVIWIFGVLLLSNPLYLFYGRTFMIEMAALFFLVSAISYGIELIIGIADLSTLLKFSFWMTLAILQKITTAAPALLVIGFLLIINLFRKIKKKQANFRKEILYMGAFIPPVLMGAVWSLYADFIKNKNFFGSQLTSKNLMPWNFGTLEQRFDLYTYKTIFWERIFQNNLGAVLGVLLIIATLIFAQKKIRIIILTSLSFFILPILIFCNLHLIHDYYQIASNISLIFAIAISIFYFLPQTYTNKNLSFILTISCVISNLLQFSIGYGQVIKADINDSNSKILAISEIIRENTGVSSGIVVFGNDWNSDISYYSERKSFTVPDWFSKYDEVWKNPVTFLGGKELGAVIYCGDGIIRQAQNAKMENDFEFLRNSKDYQLDNCLLYFQK